ncbi:hypothetical protein BKA64DRAFT_720838 [Cadophora sp. MPI-SDFR-AT-0126]|nr:hypothetical protein BKA64DRAFT_720838 [Leotiomycetes sp. MPI-SDFR-AT-0126]
MAATTSQSIASGSPAFKHVETPRLTSNATFDPKTHLAFSPPTEFYTLEELGLASPLATGPIAITAPFPLFSTEGIKQLRADLFRPSVIEKHMYREAKDPGVYKIRGYGSDAPFVYSAWTHPQLLDVCSKAAGVELEVVFDYEIGHINVQLPKVAGDEEKDILERLPPSVPPKQDIFVDEGIKAAAQENEGHLTAWHNDSYPWVCVVMLSDPTGMVGGETALRKGDGSLLKVRGPEVGCAVMMQGGLINHVALKALGNGERITMVTSFRPKNALAYDSSNLGNVKKVSNHDVLFRQWATYRAENLAKRAYVFRESLSGLDAEGIQRATANWAKEQIEYLEVTSKELTDQGAKGNYNR